MTLHGGATGDITLAGTLSGGGDLHVIDGDVQSYAAITMDNVTIDDATTSVTFWNNNAVTLYGVSTAYVPEVTSSAESVIEVRSLSTEDASTYSMEVWKANGVGTEEEGINNFMLSFDLPMNKADQPEAGEISRTSHAGATILSVARIALCGHA